MEFIQKILGRKGESRQVNQDLQEENHRDWMERRRKAVEHLGTLYERHEALSPSMILDELEEIHSNFRIPNFPPLHPEHADLWFYELTEAVANSDKLSEQETRRMVDMYNWDEVKIQGVGGVNFSILQSAERFPHPEIHNGLKSHLERAEEWKEEEGPGTHRYASLAEEVDRLKRLLPKCR